MLSFSILEDKNVNDIHYQLLERKDSISSDYNIGIPLIEKGLLSWELTLGSEWATYNFVKKLFDDIKS